MYKRQVLNSEGKLFIRSLYQLKVEIKNSDGKTVYKPEDIGSEYIWNYGCLLYTSDAADERSSVDLGGRRIIKKKKTRKQCRRHNSVENNKEKHINKHTQ